LAEFALVGVAIYRFPTSGLERREMKCIVLSELINQNIQTEVRCLYKESERKQVTVTDLTAFQNGCNMEQMMSTDSHNSYDML